MKGSNLLTNPDIASRVVHCKKSEYDVYIGRGNGSIWGNDFTHKEGTRAKQILPTRYDAVLAHLTDITEGSSKHLLRKLPDLIGKTLGCWCSPKDCHGDNLVVLAEMYRIYTSLKYPPSRNDYYLVWNFRRYVEPNDLIWNGRRLIRVPESFNTKTRAYMEGLVFRKKSR